MVIRMGHIKVAGSGQQGMTKLTTVGQVTKLLQQLGLGVLSVLTQGLVAICHSCVSDNGKITMLALDDRG